MKKNIEKRIAKIVENIVLKSESFTSLWGIYQPREPKDKIMKFKDYTQKLK